MTTIQLGWRALLRQIVGRIKEYMSAVYFGIGIFFLTTFVYLNGETKQAGLALVAAILGLAGLLMAITETKREERQRQREGKANLIVLIDIAEKLGVERGLIVKQLKDVIELREKKDGSHNSGSTDND